MPLWLVAGLLLSPPAQSDDAKPAGDGPRLTVSFCRDIAPILSKKCLKCHGAEKAKGDYQLHTFDLLMKPGENKAPTIVSGQPGRSELYRRLIASDADDRMPQKDDPLPARQIGVIEQWIKEGAHFDGSDRGVAIVTLIPREPYPDPPAAYRFPIPITALAFSPDGQELAVGGYHEITVWHPANGTLVRRIRHVAERTYGLSYTVDGSMLAAAGGAPGQTGEIALYDPVRGNVVKSLGASSDVMLALCLSPDGRRLAAGGADNAIRIFDVASGKEALVIQQHADWVMALAFSRDGRRLASASRDRSARVYNSQSGELEISYQEHGAPVLAVAFDEEGLQVLSAGKDKKIHVWSVADGKKAGEIGGFDGEITTLLRDGHALFSGSTDQRIRQHNAADRTLIRSYLGHKDRIYSLAYHAATQRLASGSHDGEVRVWSTANGGLISAFTAAPGLLTATSKQ